MTKVARNQETSHSLGVPRYWPQVFQALLAVCAISSCAPAQTSGPPSVPHNTSLEAAPPDPVLELAQRFNAEGKYEDTRTLLAHIIGESPQDWRHLRELGVAERALGNYMAAVTCFRLAWELTINLSEPIKQNLFELRRSAEKRLTSVYFPGRTDGDKVTIDGIPVDLSQLMPIYIQPGWHTFQVTAAPSGVRTLRSSLLWLAK